MLINVDKEGVDGLLLEDVGRHSKAGVSDVKVDGSLLYTLLVDDMACTLVTMVMSPEADVDLRIYFNI